MVFMRPNNDLGEKRGAGWGTLMNDYEKGKR